MHNMLEEKIKKALAPKILEIINESSQHDGHPGSPNTGNSHYRITIVSHKFQGVLPLARHKLVYKVLSQELKTMHALSLSVKTPDEI